MTDQDNLDTMIYQALQQHYVAMLGQRDTGIRTVIQNLSANDEHQRYMRFLPLTLPLAMDDVEEFKQIVLDRLITITDQTLGDPNVSQRQAEVLAQYAHRRADVRLRSVLDLLGRGSQTERVVIILHTLNKVATAPLTNLLLLLREYHDLISMPGEAAYHLRFLVVGDEPLWRMCRYKDNAAISPFNIAKIMFVAGMSLAEIRTKVPPSTEDAAREIAEFTGGVPLLVESFGRLSQEGHDANDPTMYFPYIQLYWSGLLPETRELLTTVIDGSNGFPAVIPDFESSGIPNVKEAWSDAFWSGFLRMHGSTLAWRSPIHEMFVRRMAEQAVAIRNASAPLEQRIAHLEQMLANRADAAAPAMMRQAGIALARETGSDELADMLLSVQEHKPAEEVRTRIQHLATHAPSVWLRIYCGVMARTEADLETMLLTGIVLGAKRSIRAFDVFLCHNAQEKAQVLAIAEDLLRRGILPWLDVWEAPPGKLWQVVLEGDIERCKSTAVFVGKSGVGPWQILEILAILNDFTRRNRPIVPVFLPGTENIPEIPLFLRPYTWLDLRQTAGNGAQQIVDAVRQS